jgi:glycosyltransferase involved in cell wall biosynthesis
VSIRTLHICYSFPPDPPGGTEVYVSSLCRELAAQGISALVAAPAEREHSYEVDGIAVRRFQHNRALKLEEIYAGDPIAAASFGRLLDREAVDVVHQHALTPACSPLLAIEAKGRGMPVVFTYHTPTASCLRGTMLLWGKSACDGRMEVARCSACCLESRGAGRVLAQALAVMPAAGGDWLGRLGWHGDGWTALRMSSLVQRQHDSFRMFLDLVDRVVILSPWVEAVLAHNGVPLSKMFRSGHGVAASGDARRAGKRATDRVRVIHLGRTDPAKGTELLIKALGQIPDAPLELDIYGVVQDPSATAMLERLRVLAKDDSRIRFLPPIAHQDVLATIAQYHCVAVPSQWLETGPLVVLEAFAAGVPVVASALGGLADKVTDEVDGLLVRPFDSVDAWAAALRRFTNDRDLANRLSASVGRPRSLTGVVNDMRALYESLHAGSQRSTTRGLSHAAVSSR